jgi:chromosome segregation ATPase
MSNEPNNEKDPQRDENLRAELAQIKAAIAAMTRERDDLQREVNAAHMQIDLDQKSDNELTASLAREEEWRAKFNSSNAEVARLNNLCGEIDNDRMNFETSLRLSEARETKLREALVKLDALYREGIDDPETLRPDWLAEELAYIGPEPPLDEKETL